MCDPTPIRNWLTAILVAIIAAIALIVAAAIANSSFWLAWTSPGWMLAAAAATGAAALLCAGALSALETFCTCAGSSCAGACSNMRNTVNAARVVLGIQALTCLTAALSAWIPVAGQVLMWIIIGALVIQAALIASAIGFYAQLTSCATAAPPLGSGGSGLSSVPTNEPVRISCISKSPRSDPYTRISEIGGVANNQVWRLPLNQAIQAVQGGRRFFVERPAGDRVDVVIATSQHGNKYLKTIADGDEPNNLLALPECSARVG
jgi:hypothetical protein